MTRQSGQCAAAAVRSFESFCAACSPRHLVVALRSDVHLWMLGGSGKCVCVCEDSTSPWTLQPLSCLGVGDVRAALVFTLGLTNAP